MVRRSPERSMWVGKIDILGRFEMAERTADQYLMTGIDRAAARPLVAPGTSQVQELPKASRDPDRHIRQAFQLAEQHVALDHRADIFRGAGIDDVAGLQFESFG